ncbi:SbcC/MukB-like Walker B domain-containing protein [Nocardia jiangxiensis]|uniref:Nuclease SbcCD subunit C n=1 Tax=Nocardia jiangxiensis TaxID=282685 RepID=A0ABW6RWR9_9NOCA
MRPITLSLTGFRSYHPGPVIIDFTGRELAAMLGRTGAGKSSVLGGITYALFRKSAWDNLELRQLMADGAPAMTVELTFEHENQRWFIHRTMHATNPNAGRHHLVNETTGEEIDGASPVDARIRAVLQMGHETFLRVGLLPQGKFDQLLADRPSDRTKRLRELFGTDSLDDVRRIAERRVVGLGGLITAAEVKRATMHGNPAAVAAAAGVQAELAQARADRLNTSVDVMTALRGEVAAARAAAAEIDSAARNLNEVPAPSAATVLDGIEPVAARIAAERESLNRRAEAAEQAEVAATAELAKLAAHGEDLDALNRAAVTLESLATRCEEHRGERDRIVAVTEQLAVEEAAIARIREDLEERVERTRPLTATAEAADRTARNLRSRAALVRTRLGSATAAAVHVADAIRAHGAAFEQLAAAEREVLRLEPETAAAATVLDTVQAHLDMLQLRDRAVDLAVEVHPGQDCPVCRRELPADFEPVSKTAATELRSAKKAVDDAKIAHTGVADRLAQARAGLDMAKAAVPERIAERKAAEEASQRTADAARRDLLEFAALAVDTEGVFDAEAASATLSAALVALAEHTDGPGPNAESLTEPIPAALETYTEAATAHAGQLSAEATRHTADIDADRTTLGIRERTHQKAVAELRNASTRHDRAVARTTDAVRSLPDRIKALLPDAPIDIDADAAATAEAAVATRMSEVRELIQARDTARTATNTVLAERHDLAEDARKNVEKPLTDLRIGLGSWAKAITLAASRLDSGNRFQVLELGTDSSIAEIRAFAADLSGTAAAVERELGAAAATHSARADDALAGLREHAAALADVQCFDPAADPMLPQALHPLVSAADRSVKEADQWRAEQRTAQDQVVPAANLDYAIAAGKARCAAAEVLRAELVEAKFLGHLTALSTRALLGIASDRLGQLTDGDFGFAENFEVVSRGSGVAHSPNRLSGGEKFLASLALALALAELHSRSGPRLGSLFLDEGFATLDAAALESALEILRTQTGGDRLVMIISHLHAVAETVDDVLWIDRGVDGSTARWLSPAERTELVRADLASGLLSLA